MGGTVSEEEWETYKRGPRAPGGTVNTIFELADFDADGQLTLTEYGYVFPRTAASAKVLAKFERLDDNDDGFLTTAEFNPGVRASAGL